MDYEFDNALFWGDENDGKIPVRTKKKKSTSVKTALDADSLACAVSDRDVQESRLTTPVSHFTLVTAQTQASTSLYTSSEVSGSRNYPARTVARPAVLQPGLVAAPAYDRDPPRNKFSSKYGKPGPSFSDSKSSKYGQPVSHPSDGQSYKYGQPVLYSSDGQNPYRNEQRTQGQNRGRRPYTNSTPSISGSRPQSRVLSRLGRNYVHHGSDLEDGGFRSAYITPNLYLSDPHTLGLGTDGYEGPDGFLRDNDADRAERAGLGPDGKFILNSLYLIVRFQMANAKHIQPYLVCLCDATQSLTSDSSDLGIPIFVTLL